MALLCREKISDYIEEDEDKDKEETSQLPIDDNDFLDNSYSGNEQTSENSTISLTQGIDFLIEIIDNT